MTYIYVTTSYPKSRVLMQQLREKIAIEVPYNSIYDVSFRGNRIDIRQMIGDEGYVVIRSYLIIIIPVIVDLSRLQGFSGDVYFDCEDLLSELDCAIKQLKFIEGQHVGRGNNAAFEQLARSLYDISTEHGTGEDLRQVGSILSSGLSTTEEDLSVPWAD